MHLRTRLTERLAIEHPIISAPMGFVSGGTAGRRRLECRRPRPDRRRLRRRASGWSASSWRAGNARVGCGFITWSLANNPALLDQVLDAANRQR